MLKIIYLIKIDVPLIALKKKNMRFNFYRYTVDEAAFIIWFTFNDSFMRCIKYKQNLKVKIISCLQYSLLIHSKLNDLFKVNTQSK